MPVAECASSAMMRASSGSPEQVKLVREPMMRDAGDAGVAEANLLDAAGGGVALIGGVNVALEQRAHVRQSRGEFAA